MIAAFLLGAVSALGFAPFGWFPLPILALAVLFLSLRNARPRQALLAGWAYGMGLFLVGVSWVYVSLAQYGGMAPALAVLATLLFCGVIALYPALALWLGVRLSAPMGVSMGVSISKPSWALVVLPASWALLEWVRGWLFTGFPWLALGYSQVPDSPLMGYAPLFGVYGVGLLAALSAGALASLNARALILMLALWLGGWALTEVHWTRPLGAPVTVALLQGNVAQEMKFRPEALQRTLADYRAAVLASDARLIVLPETALPLLLENLPMDYLPRLAAHVRARGGDVLLGVPENDASGRYYNGVISVGTAPEGHYRKVHLVPFGEFLPPGFHWVLQILSIPMSDFSRGAEDQAPLVAAGQKLAVNICYEDVFGEERIAAARASSMLVNVSNDAWFGASFASSQHLQIGAMRSVEAGRWQLRVNNTGYTAVVDEHGRVRSHLTPFTQGRLDARVPGMSGDTPYLRWGNWPAIMTIFLLLMLAWRRPDPNRG